MRPGITLRTLEEGYKDSAMTTENTLTFGFGENWRQFIDRCFDDGREAKSREHILRFLKLDSLAGKTFLDVGCGSGLSSLAALRAGAEEVISFDVDPKSVASTQYLRKREGEPNRWRVLSGSVLDEQFVSKLPRADIVYSWGVLHHTGSMWQAISNTVSLMKNRESLFYLAIYEKRRSSKRWLTAKEFYNRAPVPIRRSMDYSYGTYLLALDLLCHRKLPWTVVASYRNSRGMDFMTDVRDWLGGLPFEFASPDEILEFMQKFDLSLTRIATGEANAEYLFVRK